MLWTESGTEAFHTDAQFANAYRPIARTGFPLISEGTATHPLVSLGMLLLAISSQPP